MISLPVQARHEDLRKTKAMPKSGLNVQGFTLFEVVVVLIIIGIVMAVVAVRVFDTTASLESNVNAVKAQIRYTQILAMNSDKSAPGVWGIVFQKNKNRYWLFHCGAPSTCKQGKAINRKVLPGSNPRNDNIIYLSDLGLTLTRGGVIAFDTYGRPFKDSKLTKPLTGNRVFKFSDAANHNKAIRITAETGFVP